MSIPIRGYQELHKTVHDGFGREVCQRKCADIHFQNLSGATCPLRFTVPQHGPRARRQRPPAPKNPCLTVAPAANAALETVTKHL